MYKNNERLRVPWADMGKPDALGGSLGVLVHAARERLPWPSALGLHKQLNVLVRRDLLDHLLHRVDGLPHKSPNQKHPVSFLSHAKAGGKGAEAGKGVSGRKGKRLESPYGVETFYDPIRVLRSHFVSCDPLCRVPSCVSWPFPKPRSLVLFPCALYLDGLVPQVRLRVEVVFQDRPHKLDALDLHVLVVLHKETQCSTETPSLSATRRFLS